MTHTQDGLSIEISVDVWPVTLDHWPNPHAEWTRQYCYLWRAFLLKKKHICLENTPRRSPTIHIWCRMHDKERNTDTWWNLKGRAFSTGLINNCNTQQELSEQKEWKACLVCRDFSSELCWILGPDYLYEWQWKDKCLWKSEIILHLANGQSILVVAMLMWLFFKWLSSHALHILFAVLGSNRLYPKF